ncbi:hypothetical protein V5O48_011347, partial [Marasmius crinis-equi]
MGRSKKRSKQRRKARSKQKSKETIQHTQSEHPTTSTAPVVADVHAGTQSPQNTVQPGPPLRLTTPTPTLTVSNFANAHGGTFIHPNFSYVGGNQTNHNYSNPYWILEILWQAIAEAGASHDSAARYPLIGCHPNTREEILQTLLKWARYPADSSSAKFLSASPFYWLYGPAGHGKSTVAQSFSEQCAKKGFLLASFFFSRNDPKRDNPTYLFLTIAYGLASSIPQLRDIIGVVIQKNPAILRSSFDAQFRELVVEPCRSLADSWESSWPHLVIIDGLDECQGSGMQRHILSILSSPYCEVHGLGGIPLHFLICSRPEPTIRETFDSPFLYPHSQRTPLNDSWKARRDIRHYLTDRLNAIHSEPRYSAIQFPNPWPPYGTAEYLADKSNG